MHSITEFEDKWKKLKIKIVFLFVKIKKQKHSAPNSYLGDKNQILQLKQQNLNLYVRNKSIL